jgi:hypothetical protein
MGANHRPQPAAAMTSSRRPRGKGRAPVVAVLLACEKEADALPRDGLVRQGGVVGSREDAMGLADVAEQVLRDAEVLAAADGAPQARRQRRKTTGRTRISLRAFRSSHFQR